jgi:hypothetical protein
MFRAVSHLQPDRFDEVWGYFLEVLRKSDPETVFVWLESAQLLRNYYNEWLEVLTAPIRGSKHFMASVGLEFVEKVR